MRYLVTASLYNAYKFLLSCSEDKYEQKKMEFVKTLRREKSAPTPLMLRGINFENAVRSYTEGKPPQNKVIQEIGDIVKGGTWQEKVKGEIEVAGLKILLYGIMDVKCPPIINDIKRPNNYALGKYYDGIQHLLYLHCTQLPRFRYLVAYGVADEPQDWTAEDYHLDDNTLPMLKERIAEMLNWFEGAGFMPLYKEFWQAKGDR